jgi:hypothetical protein
MEIDVYLFLVPVKILSITTILILSSDRIILPYRNIYFCHNNTPDGKA